MLRCSGITPGNRKPNAFTLPSNVEPAIHCRRPLRRRRQGRPRHYSTLRGSIDGLAMNTLLDVKGLTKTYGKLVALHQITFKIQAGEIVGLIGPNGAGKTTLIGVLSGAIKPNAGSIVYCGR